MRTFRMIALIALSGLFQPWADARSQDQNDVPFFNSARTNSFRKVIAVSDPTVYNIKAIAELRRKDLWPSDGTAVVGIYHCVEDTEYAYSRLYVRAKGLDWFFFHPVEDPLNDEDIFRKNACSDDFKKIFKKSDAVIFFGGPDIPPSLYGSKTNSLSVIEDPNRHRFELSFIFHLLGGFQDNGFRPLLESDSDFPVLGNCLGCQSLNVGTGGTLVQDIFSEVYGKIFLEDALLLDPSSWHNNPWYKLYPDLSLRKNTLHPIQPVRTSRFFKNMGLAPEDRPLVLSSHHQAVQKFGKGFQSAAFSEDGKVVEAIEHKRFPNVLGVQFHPEYLPLWEGKDPYRILPADTTGKTYTEVLEQNPPSVRFHRALWSWFFKKVSRH